ncbi:Nuclear pore complex protein NUP88 [Dichanthelium oligosanthes]|uniref:Nuclear pore complex protein NUP88 n=1 Tax=Dichanthelium oligosanthes TaxID=888268 RepID=A0A1E5UZY5_9POAL|nr:Nuclear pore complex protein NUP88 [Dichanthelium oligosanthes]
MTRITAPPPPSSPPGSPPPIRHTPAPATPPSLRRGRHSPSPSLALTPSSASTSAATSSRPKLRPTPKRAYTPAQWVPLSSHPVFSRRDGEGGGGGAAWDATASRLYAWDPSACGAQRIGVRIRDPEAENDGEEVAVEAAVPSEMLMPETDLGYVVTHVSLNTDGSSLLLVGSHNLSVLYVHERVSEDGDTIICRTAPIASKILPSNSDGIKVLQASWHPFSNNHFSVLTSDAVFRLFDLSSDLEQPEQEFYLQPILPGKCQNASAICPVAFSYGSDHLWDRFSVFILFSDGSIFVLCPVVPFGSDYSKKHIQEIYEDVNAFGLKSSNPNVVTNSHLAIAWLEATFPDLLHQSTDMSLLMSKAHPYAPVDDSLTLQGPLCRVCEENNESESKSSACEGKAVGFMYSSAGKDSVLVTAWGSGQLQVDALADEIQPQWNIGIPTCLNVDSHGQIKRVAMVCDSNSQDPLSLRSHRPSSTGSNVKSNIEAVWMGHSPPLLRLAIVDLALPKTPSDSSLSLFPDPLVPERFYCAHGGGLDMVTLHFLPFSYPEMASTPPSVHPVLTTGNSETSSPFLSGFVSIADAYGHVQLVGITCLGECFVVEMKGWKEPTPLQLDIDSKSIKDVEPPATGMISKELIAGPDPPILPYSSSLKSLTPDSIEGKSTLHHYIKVFHEYYVEYGHKVFIELKEHADYVKTELEDKQKRLEAVKKTLLSIETKDQDINKRIDRAFKVYELLEKRVDSFKILPAANKKPLSQAEQEFKAQLDRFADVELDALHSSIAALSARMKRFAQQSAGGAAGTGVIPWQAPKAGRSHVSESQMSLLKSSLEKLSLLNEENNLKLRLIDHELKNKEQ